MEDFAAIDFETANWYRSSVCSIGVVIVRDGRVVEKIYRLIRPEPNFYCQWATDIHGLSKDDTQNALTFPARAVPPAAKSPEWAVPRGPNPRHTAWCSSTEAP